MSGPGGWVLTVSGHSFGVDRTPDERVTIAERWRDIAVGHLERARLMRHDGDISGAEEMEAAAADWCEAADGLEWGVAA